ncbi:hypothetical protein [Dyella caseinilytica]|uniref:Uncharacterized protein n=1 Tax=Dyella caseinilytica TaxID=1849581 RepID=A0ABX7GPM6_9GAMM|nr:hypothetical protein [Dyella caseinilytica]QRN52384.1 hypothetical protein ISN74_12940 [Dyella caseinilytica]GGA05474.1 hypothetical protein GCM10011408_28040 [Dyella caseinilytica]
MPVGFQVFGDSGAVQIDDNYANLALVGKGTLSPGNPGQDGGNMMQVSTGAANAMIFLRASQIGVAVGAVSDSGGVRTFTIWMASGVTSVNYWVFGTPPAPTSRFGLQIFRSDGQCTFDSANKYMRVIGNIDTSSATIGGTAGKQFGLPGVGPGGYAVALNYNGFIIERLSIQGGQTLFRVNQQWCFSISGNALTVWNRPNVAGITYPPGSTSTTTYKAPQSAIILDVTGL